jgi:predicted ester cyclase
MPANEKDLVGVTNQNRDLFRPFLGKPMKDAFDAMRDTVRNAVVHLTPGQELRVPDYFDDVEKCRQAVPVLRYMARRLIEEERRSV